MKHFNGLELRHANIKRIFLQKAHTSIFEYFNVDVLNNVLALKTYFFHVICVWHFIRMRLRSIYTIIQLSDIFSAIHCTCIKKNLTFTHTGMILTTIKHCSMIMHVFVFNQIDTGKHYD